MENKKILDAKPSFVALSSFLKRNQGDLINTEQYEQLKVLTEAASEEAGSYFHPDLKTAYNILLSYNPSEADIVEHLSKSLNIKGLRNTDDLAFKVSQKISQSQTLLQDLIIEFNLPTTTNLSNAVKEIKKSVSPKKSICDECAAHELNEKRLADIISKKKRKIANLKRQNSAPNEDYIDQLAKQIFSQSEELMQYSEIKIHLCDLILKQHQLIIKLEHELTSTKNQPSIIQISTPPPSTQKLSKEEEFHISTDIIDRILDICHGLTTNEEIIHYLQEVSTHADENDEQKILQIIDFLISKVSESKGIDYEKIAFSQLNFIYRISTSKDIQNWLLEDPNHLRNQLISEAVSMSKFISDNVTDSDHFFDDLTINPLQLPKEVDLYLKDFNSNFATDKEETLYMMLNQVLVVFTFLQKFTNHIKSECSEKDATISDLEARIDELEHAEPEEDTRVPELEAELTNVLKELQDVNSKFENFKKQKDIEIGQFKDQIDHADAARNEMQSDHQQQIQEMQLQIRKVMSEKSEAEADATTAHQQLKEIEEQINGLQTSNDDLYQQLAKLQSQLTESKIHNQDLQSQLDDQEALFAEKEQQMAEFAQNLENEIVNLSRAMKAQIKPKLIEDLKTQLDKANEQNEELIQQNKDLQNELKSVKETVKQKIYQMKTEQKTLIVNNKVQSSKIQALESQLKRERALAENTIKMTKFKIEAETQQKFDDLKGAAAKEHQDFLVRVCKKFPHHVDTSVSINTESVSDLLDRVAKCFDDIDVLENDSRELKRVKAAIGVKDIIKAYDEQRRMIERLKRQQHSSSCLIQESGNWESWAKRLTSVLNNGISLPLNKDQMQQLIEQTVLGSDPSTARKINMLRDEKKFLLSGILDKKQTRKEQKINMHTLMVVATAIGKLKILSGHTSSAFMK